jgi:hypothetical protein
MPTYFASLRDVFGALLDNVTELAWYVEYEDDTLRGNGSRECERVSGR